MTLLPFTAAGSRGLVSVLKPAEIIDSSWPAVARTAPGGDWLGSHWVLCPPPSPAVGTHARSISQTGGTSGAARSLKFT